MSEPQRSEARSRGEPAAHVDLRLLPFAPLLYVVWADGALDAKELEALRSRIARNPAIDAETQRLLASWLDPASPPESAALDALIDAVRRLGASVPESARRSLGALGSEIARRTSLAELPPAVAEALREIEGELGVLVAEAARAVLPAGEDAPAVERAPSFDPAALNALLDPDHRPLRARVLELLVRPEFALHPDDGIIAYRARVHAWCHRLAEEGLGGLAFPREFGGEHDATRAIAVFETLAFHDLSLLVKFGVQFGLFGGSIYQLGTRRHHERYLRDVASLALPGCFAMTETAHGSNVRDIETTATYDPAAREFVIHTPHERAAKDYIGNAAVYGRMATVFAQLEVFGRRQGVHAFLVPIRNEVGQPLPGVRVQDCGPKLGLNGIDNGRLWFDHVRIPRDNLLDRFATVNEDGSYTSPIASPGRRFFTMLGTLVAGRISIAAASVNTAKTALAIAIRYTDERRQFGPEGRAEMPVLDYLTMQQRLLPALATAYALDFAIGDLARRYGAHASETTQEIEALAAGLKAWASANAIDTIRACREACGGLGYLSVTRIPAILADADIFTTFEGANTVLDQLVARGLLTEYRDQFGELRLWSAVRWLTGRATAAIADLNPIAPRRTDPEHLRDPAFHLVAFHYREERLLTTLARRLKRRIDEGEDSFSALNACQDHAVALARAHAERVILESFQAAVERASDDRSRRALEPLLQLFALSRLHHHAAWYLEKGYFEGAKTRAIREQVNQLCSEIRPNAVAYTDAFGIPEALLPDFVRRERIAG